MKKTLLIAALAAVAALSGCSGHAANESEIQVGEENKVKSVLTEKITTTFISGGNSWYDEKNPENVLQVLSSFEGFYLPKYGISCFPFSLAQRNPRSFDLAGIVNEKNIYTITRLYDEKIGEFFVYNFYAPNYNTQLCVDDENGNYYVYEEPNIKPFEKADDILSAVQEARADMISSQEKSVPVNTELAAWDWVLAGLEIRAAKHLSAKDFEGISIGSTIEDVASVDPITAMSQPDDNSLKFDTFHYTDDGILRISFARKTVSEEFLVSEIELNKTFEVGYNGSPAVSGEPTVTLKINPEHLPSVNRNDISVKEIHGLKGASKAEICQSLGEPHGSVSGGSFQQFHYILENGDIAVFSSAPNGTPQQISIYNKNGELIKDI